MAAIKYKVKLTESERCHLNEVSHRGKTSVRTVKRALALLQADEGLRDGEIAGVLTTFGKQSAPSRTTCLTTASQGSLSWACGTFDQHRYRCQSAEAVRRGRT